MLLIQQFRILEFLFNASFLPAARIRNTGRSSAWILVAALAILTAPHSSANDTIYGVQLRSSTPAFQLFDHINEDSTIANPDSPLFIITGGVYGAAFKDEVFYGVELENGTSNEFLITVPHVGDALGERVSETPIGFSNIEGLANVEGQLMAVSLDFSNHISRLISIDHESGIGTLIGSGSFDVILVGLAYDPVGETLYGAGIPFGDNDDTNLYTVDPATGATTLVGDLGTTLQSLSWNAALGLIGSFDHLYQINASTGQATQIGSTDYTDGLGIGEGIFNGIYALAAIPDVQIGTVSITAIAINGSGEVMITWESETGFAFHVERNETLEPDAWTTVSDVLPGGPDSMSYNLGTGALLEGKFYRVVKSLP